MPAASIAACLLTAIAIGGCTSSANPALSDGDVSSSAPAHGSLTDHEFDVAVAVARAEADKAAANAGTSATATVGVGTETEANVGPPCTSGTLLHIKLIGTFNAVVTDLADGSPVSTVVITADPESGKACLISVQVGPTTPDPGATLLFTK